MKPTDPEEEIARLLGRLAPAPPQEPLMKQLRAAKPAGGSVIPISRWLVPVLSAAAAAAITLLLTPGRTQGPPAEGSVASASAAFVPLPEARRNLVEIKDLGVALDGDSKPFRLIRTTWLDETFDAPESGSEPVKKAYLSQEIFPVAIDTF